MFYLEEGYSTRGRLGNFLLGWLVLKREWALNFSQRFRGGKLYDEICFLFRRKSSFCCCWDIYIFVVTFDHVGKQLDKAWFPLWVNVRYLRQYVNIFSFITSYPKWKRLSKIISQYCHTLNQIKPCDNLILKSILFDSKLKLFQGLILVQRADILAHANVKKCITKENERKKENKNASTTI